MKLKSLLLGSAAALVVASGAQAADAIMAAQPEPVDYVRVCDAFGTGYFYIPGTETCLHVGGYVRQEVGGGDLLGNTNAGGAHSTWFHTRFAFTPETYSNTELGVLHTYTELRFDYTNDAANDYLDENNGNGGNGVDVHFAYIELGGFRIGLTESEFGRLQFYGNEYAGAVINDTLVGYGPFQAQQISYTYKNPNGFSAFLGVEDDNGGSNDGGSSVTLHTYDPDVGDTVSTTTAPDDDYIPDVLAGVAYNNGTFGAALIGAYDSSLEEGAIKARVDGKFGRVALWLMGAWSSNGDETGQHGCTSNASITSCGSNRFAVWGGDWAIWGGGGVDLTQKVSANLQLSYDDNEDFGATGNLVFHVVPGFDVTTEVSYADAGTHGLATGALTKDVDSAWGGVVRFQRSF